MALNQLSGLEVGLDASMQITHLFYMDDLKVYAERHEKLIGVMRRVGEAVGMAMGLRKCAIARLDKPAVSDDARRSE